VSGVNSAAKQSPVIQALPVDENYLFNRRLLRRYRSSQRQDKTTAANLSQIGGCSVYGVLSITA